MNRHVECTDCHNPHRVMRNSRFNSTGSDTERTHTHVTGAPHSNVASGALRGTWGVEPRYSGAEFLSLPFQYDVKSGDAGDANGDGYVTVAESFSYVTEMIVTNWNSTMPYGYWFHPHVSGTSVDIILF